jgi:hypothetical protein
MLGLYSPDFLYKVLARSPCTHPTQTSERKKQEVHATTPRGVWFLEPLKKLIVDMSWMDLGDAKNPTSMRMAATRAQT